METPKYVVKFAKNVLHDAEKGGYIYDGDLDAGYSDRYVREANRLVDWLNRNGYHAKIKRRDFWRQHFSIFSEALRAKYRNYIVLDISGSTYHMLREIAETNTD